MKTKLFQWRLFALLIGFAFMLQNCQEEDSTTLEEIQNSTELGAKTIKISDKLNVCHYDVVTGLWSLKSYSVNSVPQHLLHGDVVLVDADADGYVSAINECVPGGDCNDADPTVNPGATEVCDGIDNNCDGSVDEGFDLDGDGFTVCQGDCDDSDPSVYPGATEICDNGIDDNCDGQIDEDCDSDTDGDGVPDDIDQCPNTPPGNYNQVNPNGCAWFEQDDDDDGVLNGVDQCPNTPPGNYNQVFPDGCAWFEQDDDDDGVLNGVDDCPYNPGPSETNGCPL